MYSRRLFLKNSAATMFSVGSAPVWLSRAVYARGSNGPPKKVLIVIFQRGAVDGLSMAVPHGEEAYYAGRPSIAIPRPGSGDASAIELDGHFGLHPSLKSLLPLWEARQLAIVDAVGSPDATRSHFDAQDYMESGTPGYKATSDGWLNRALPTENSTSALRAVAMSPDLPLSLRGREHAVAVNSIADFQIRDKQVAAEFASLYGNTSDPILKGTAKETLDAMRIMREIQKGGYTPAAGAQYPKGRFGESMRQIARMIKFDVGLEVAFADIGGWDTHVEQANQLANHLKEFGDALAAFTTDMGDRMEDIVVVTMSEFGRTVKENGDRGTDHGHANVMFVIGGAVRGGRMYGEWPGLNPEQLYERRDLQVTTDFRAVLWELVSKQLGDREMRSVFPNFNCSRSLGLLRA